jgi:NADH-quinone oxidoreductase subunit F
MSNSFDLSRLRAALGELAPQGRSALLPALHLAQNLYGCVSEPIAAEIGRTLNVPLADVHGVIEFYALLYKEPVGRSVLRICTDPSCALNGAEELLKAACRKAGVAEGKTSGDGAVTVERAPCLGLCHAPVGVNLSQQMADGSYRSSALAHADGNDLDALFAGRGSAPFDYVGGDICIVTPLCGRGRRVKLIEYKAAGGMQGLAKALTHTPAQVIEEIKQSGLMGRGGAAFPTWIKWDGAAKAPGSPKYFVVNADESEPGTFKDRIMLEGDPCRAIEGAIIGAYAIGAQRIYFFIRGEYPTVVESVQAAIAECCAAGYLGENILGSGYSVDIEVRIGGGAYICGEETALFEAIEGKRGLPRIKPPYPATHGLFGKPTVINNVETLAKAPYIFNHGGAAFRQFGTEKSTGPKLVCVSGDVVRPGLYEIPFGVTLRHLIDDLAGGVIGGDLQAILLGGAAGSFADARHLDVRISFEDLRSAGLTLGSGAVMVFNTERDLRDVLKRLARFFAHESCGKCYPCQLGTQRQYEILDRLAARRPIVGDWDRLHDVGWTMSEASLCGLGQTAASAVLSAMKLWPTLFEEN